METVKNKNIFPGSHIVTGATAVHILFAFDPEAMNTAIAKFPW